MSRCLVVSEVAAWSVGILCGLALCLFKVQAIATERSAAHSSSITAAPSASAARNREAPGSDVVRTEGDVMGRLEIHSIGLSVPILEGFDPWDLRKGIGHIQGTAMPGGLGNMALVGHRDTFFRPLRNIRPGMTVTIFANGAHFDYLVDKTSIVDPSEVSVLEIHDVPDMTLVTCYPFDFIGSAPKRFIVRAHLKSIEPSAH